MDNKRVTVRISDKRITARILVRGIYLDDIDSMIDSIEQDFDCKVELENAYDD